MSTIIKLNNLSIKSDQQQIIKDLSFEIQEGEFVSITGPSGSGKSTVLKYLAQIIDPTLNISGSYSLDGKDVNDYPPVELRQKVSYFFQTPSLFGETVRDNLAFPYEIRNEEFDEEKAKQRLQRVNLSTSYLDKSIKSLSGGERQRVALIRNLMFDPDVLLLDEITSALDRNTRDIIWDWLQEYRQETGVTILMISHIDEEHEMTDRQIKIPKLDDSEVKDEEDNDKVDNDDEVENDQENSKEGDDIDGK